MVDARLTPLAAMGLDRNTLMHDGLRLHSGVVYPGIRALPVEKSRDTPGFPLTYNRDGLPELIYKPDGSMDSRKAANGYLGLYKGTPPGLHRVPGTGAECMGLDRRLGPGEKASELGMVGAGGSYLRLPWFNPYPEASMYSYLDTSKYAALNMYKASLLGQPNPYLPQMSYQSLCAAQGGNVNPATSAAERLYYMPPYPPSPISSPMVAPPMRIPAVTVAPTSLVHCQDKGLGPSFAQQHHQQSPHPQHHQAAMDRDRSPSRSSRPGRPPSRKSSNNNSNNSSTSTSGANGGNNNSVPIDSSPHASSRLSQPPPPPALIDNSLDLQRPVARIGQPPTSSTSSMSASSSSTQSIPHSFSVSSMASEQNSPARPSPHKSRPRDGPPEHRSAGVERRPSRSPSKPNFERSAHQPQATKDPAEKPLDLSGRMLEFGLPPNGFPVKMDTMASGPRYGLPPNRELLKENLSLSPSSHHHSVVNSTSSKVSDRPEMISTLHSSWVVPSPSPSHAQHTPGLPPSPRPNTDLGLSQAKGSSPSVIKHKSLERVLPQQRSSSCPRIGESNHNVPSTQHSTMVSSQALSPKPNGEWVKQSTSQSEHPTASGHHREGTEKPSQTTKRVETTPDVSSYKRPCLENGHPPGHLYLPQSDSYLNHSLAYANRYLHYPIPDGMALHSLPITGKGPVYPHPVMLGSNSLYPSHLATKHPLPYHNLPPGPGGEYLTYNSQEMAHPLMQTHSDNKLPDRGDATLKPRGHEKSRGAVEECMGHRNPNSGKETYEGSQIKPDREAGAQRQSGGQSKSPLSSVTSLDKIVCIDLVHSDTDIESTPAAHKQPSAESCTKVNQNECFMSNQNQKKTDYEPKHHLSHPYPVHSGQSPNLKPNHTDRQPDTPFGKPKILQDAGCPGLTSCTSPVPQGQEEAEESLEECPSPDPRDQDQSTLRCARTSGERGSGKDKRDRDSRALRLAQHCTTLLKEEENVCERDTEKEDSIVDLGESHEEGDEDDDDDDEDDDGSHTSSKGLRRSSLAKRIANSTGYVGDRIKCVTTELYADSSKLSREQRALQRAMMRFSELELKEKEGGGVCVSASAAGQELADGQCRERTLEHCQHATRQGEREGVRPLYTNNRVPVLQRCGGQKEPLSPGHGARCAAQGGLRDGGRKPMRECDGGHCMPPILTPARGFSEEKFGPGFGANRKRPLIPKAEQDDSERGDGERVSHLQEKRFRFSTDDHEHASPDEEEDDDVRKLKVCIELKGLRLSKPAAAAAAAGADGPQIKQERPWPQARCEAPPHSQRERKIRATEAEDRAAAHRAEINRKWGCEKLLNGVAASPLPPSQVKDRAQPPLGPFSGDRGLKEPRRGPPSPSPELSVGGAPPLKPRRHSDTDKPKGKRPCKTKHTSQREREREKRKEAAPSSPGQRCVADLGAAEDDNKCGAPRKGAASPNHYPCSPVKPCSPAVLCPPSLTPQTNGRAACGGGGVPAEVSGGGLHRTPPAAAPSPPAVRPIPPEARRLIVNKNAGETLLQRAARLGYEEVVLYCLENRVCEVNHRDYAGYCALHEACARGWLTIVQHLLDYGADINCSAQDGTRPIHDAVENDHLDVVRILLSYGADPTLATYSGRGLLKMTHSDGMERFLTDYFADLQGRSDDDPGLYWEFYGSAVCEFGEEGGVYDILADPPGPDDGDEDDKREVFEFEFSDRPLLPCYNIQVSLSQGPRNWLLLSDVLRRLRMSARGFRQAFPHMEVVTVAEAEFYRQASLSQLFSCPEELEGFQPDSKDLLDLVEDSAELAALLGSTLECLDDHWDRQGDKLKDKIKAFAKLGSS